MSDASSRASVARHRDGDRRCEGHPRRSMSRPHPRWRSQWQRVERIAAFFVDDQLIPRLFSNLMPLRAGLVLLARSAGLAIGALLVVVVR